MNNKIDIFHSAKSKGIEDISPDVLELGLDALIESESLKDVPFFGIAFKTFSLYKNLTEAFFIKKLLRFLYELKEIPQIDREKFISEIESKEETNKAGEKLLITLNRLNDIDKAEIIGRLFKNTILGNLEFKEFTRLSHIVDNAYIDDLKLLKGNRQLFKINNDVKANLNSIGLLNQKISDLTRAKRLSERSGVSIDLQPTFEYRANNYCILLIENGFS